jgi:mRNA interferase MazF
MAVGSGYFSKPRQAVIIQDDCFLTTLSITACPLTSQLIDASILRILVEVSPQNSLRAPSRPMVDLRHIE